MRASAPEVRLFIASVLNLTTVSTLFRPPKQGDFGLGAFKSVPRRLKPRLAYGVYGTAEAVPFVQRIFRSLFSPDI
jgi:hypothetical protein